LYGYNGQQIHPKIIKKNVLEMIDVYSHLLFIFLSADLEKREEKVQSLSRIEKHLYGNSFTEELMT
jgi:hypothetical protein